MIDDNLPDADGYVHFGTIAVTRLQEQCQYAIRNLIKWPHDERVAYLGNGIRVKTDDYHTYGNYHSVRIHQDDVETYIERVKEWRLTEPSYVIEIVNAKQTMTNAQDRVDVHTSQCDICYEDRQCITMHTLVDRLAATQRILEAVQEKAGTKGA